MLGKIASKTLKKGTANLRRAGVIAGHNLGKAAVTTAGVGAGAGKLAAVGFTDNVKRTTKAVVNAASGLVKEDRANSLLGYRLNKRGFALAAGVGVLSTTAKETKTYFKEDLRGRQDGYTTPYAPRMSTVGNGYGSYGQQAGATGDLVFALNKNRRG